MPVSPLGQQNHMIYLRYTGLVKDLISVCLNAYYSDKVYR